MISYFGIVEVLGLTLSAASYFLIDLSLAL
jgi:hypothetical protein